MSTLTDAPMPTQTDLPAPTVEEHYSSWSLFIVCVLLIISLWTSYYLQIKRIRVVHETIISIFAGMVVGLVVRLAPGTLIREMLTFKHTLFFNLLLPPIILNSGYELKQDNFFRNFGSILTFAFLGTFISAVGLGVLVYIWSFLGLESLQLSLLECLIFGSTLSATDPVTILAIFNQYKVDPKLYSVIFGESILNDAVSIVMYDTLSQFHGEDIYLSSLFRGVGIFLFSFSMSMALGVFFGLLVSLTLKHSHLSFYPSLESCLVALMAYTSYFFSNGMQMSGIVSLLFCGITLKHYAYHTMSRRTQRTTKYIFSMLAQLSENFIFIYLGLSIFTNPPREDPLTNYIKPLFITITIVSVIFTRYASVFPLSEAINLFHRHARGQRHDELPHSYQMMLFWAGLRGAVGVALAAGFQGKNAQTLRTTVLVVVVATVILFGGTTARMLEVLGVRTGVEDDAGSSSDEEADRAFFAGASGTPARFSRRGGRLARSWGTQTYGYTDDDHDDLRNPRVAPHSAPPAPNARAIFSASSGESDSDIGEVLPMSSPVHHHTPREANAPGPGHGHVGEDGKWFQALDERYLLPLFSNATASRTFHARKALARRGMGGEGTGGESEDDHEDDALVDEHAAGWRELGHGVASGSGTDDTGGEEHRNFSDSMSNFFDHLRWGPPGAGRERGRDPTPQDLPQSDPRQSAHRVSSMEDARTQRGLGSPSLRGGRDVQ
ncbi:sodium/hydrogen exchanger [Ramaria rubella]|nr:sodium/hydrogen exchanger [Ramaria rubella]